MTPNQPTPFTTDGQQLHDLLAAADHPATAAGRTYHVASIGRTFYFAYEQLRNATEYREHHLLLRSAIERFLVRQVSLSHFQPIGAELITDLTQAGYLQNDQVALSTLEAIDATMQAYSAYFTAITQGYRIPAATSTRWLFQIASVQIESLISPNPRLGAFMRFAYDHFLHSIDADQFGANPDHPEYQLAVYCAMQRAIFKSDAPTIRYYWSSGHLSQAQAESPAEFVRLNQAIDSLFQAPLTNRLERLINRYGAPIRVLREVIAGDGQPAALMADRSALLTRARNLSRSLTAQVHKRLRGRIVKAILFILLTKVLIGLAAEVPYDISRYGAIAWQPLLINILLPLIYMALLGFTIGEPGPENTTVIASWIERILYPTDEGGVRYRLKSRVTSSGLRRAFSVVYAIGFVGSLSLVAWSLHRLGFNVVNGVIFVIFFSAVSFLGFRLRQTARELAMIDERPNLIRTVTDFLSTPFVRMGHWLSDRYSRINLVTRLLDVAIEMPFKTTLRLIQQWVGFMRDKQEEI